MVALDRVPAEDGPVPDVEDHLSPEARTAGVRFVADTASIPGESLDVVLCHHALEHLLEPARTLREFRNLLVPGGLLLLYVPYEKERRYRRFDPDEPNHHLYSWNPQSLGNLVTEAGFTVTEARIAEFGYDRFAACWAVRLKLGRWGYRLIRRAAHFVRPLKETRVVARKPAPSPLARA